ncbi:dynein light chain [Rhodotorula paludigena]|uniref:Dynein light chain n=1 Tax=Rhodotorula paludigena TaxID=86838 RepID=A0AAV5GLF0_9BASI|nr:hypothetical protein Rhopal_003350-T1 [Rhodotorula paludigena]
MSQAALADGSNTPEGPKTTIKSADMSEEMQKVAIEVATEAMQAPEAEEKDIAAHIKRDFDKRYGPTWHVVVGKNFGSYCTHETGHFLYWYMGNIAILLFKAG